MNPQQAPDEREVARRRLVVQYALGGLLSDAELQQAVALWDQSFANSRAFALVSFVNKLDEVLGLGPRAKTAQRSLAQRMFLREDELAPAAAPAATNQRGWGEAPSPTLPAPAPAAPVAQHPSSPAAVIFAALLSSAIRGLVRRLEGGGSTLARYLKKNVDGLGLGAEARAAVVPWCDSSVEGTLSLSDPGDMKALMHAIYLFACENLGPTMTDRLFASAVREADELPEAARFSPRKLF